MEFKGTKKAELYAENKSSSLVFKNNHIKDYLAGYNQALEDSKSPEMLGMLNRCHSWIINCNGDIQITKDIERLIKEATEL